MRQNIHDKKAQVTIFIILGIILIIFASVVYYVYSTRFQVSSADIQDAVEEAPVEVKPIQEFVLECLDDVSTEGIIKLGEHGGYIDLLDAELSDRDFELDILDPTGSDGVLLDNDVSNGVAYWWYMDTDNECVDCSLSNRNIPTKSSMEIQLKTYVEREIKGCIDGFKGFERQGFDINELGDPVVTVGIAEADVSLFMEYPIEVNIDGRTTEVSRFYRKVPLTLNDFYELARAITAEQVDTNFIEDVFIYLLGVYSSPDMERLPPLFAREFGSRQKFWIKSMVKSTIEDILSTYIPIIQLANTKNGERYQIEQDSADNDYYALFHRGFDYENYGDYTVRFLYLDQPIYLHMNPDGDMIGPSEVKARALEIMGVSFGSPGQENTYEVLYDVSFPVIVEIRKENALFDRPYVFYIALEANIRNNRNINRWMAGDGTMAPIDRSKFSRSVLDEVMLDEEAMDIPNLDGNITESLFCNKHQRISGNLTITTTNASSGDSLGGVEVKYGCGDHRNCGIGTTQFDLETETGVLVTPLPVCIGGGYLKLSKDGFREKVITGITSEVGEELEFEVALEEIKTKNISIKKFVTVRETVEDENGEEVDNWLSWTGVSYGLDISDQVMMTVTKIDVEAYEQPFSKTLVMSGNTSANNPDLLKIDLIQGKYVINAQLQNMVGTIIPHTCNDDIEDDITMAPTMLGGLEFNESYPWVINYDDLMSGDTVEFYVVAAPLPRCFDDFNETEEVKEFYPERRAELNPKFK